MRKQILLIILLIKMLYFWYKFPEENLVDKCLRFYVYIEENGKDPSYSQLHISIKRSLECV